MNPQQQDYEQRRAECEWAIKQCALKEVSPEAVAILAHECGFNRTDVKLILAELTQEIA
jgi:hypothetical protein